MIPTEPVFGTLPRACVPDNSRHRISENHSAAWRSGVAGEVGGRGSGRGVSFRRGEKQGFAQEGISLASPRPSRNLTVGSVQSPGACARALPDKPTTNQWPGGRRLGTGQAGDTSTYGCYRLMLSEPPNVSRAHGYCFRSRPPMVAEMQHPLHPILGITSRGTEVPYLQDAHEVQSGSDHFLSK